jgi:hypothetical protein
MVCKLLVIAETLSLNGQRFHLLFVGQGQQFFVSDFRQLVQ